MNQWSGQQTSNYHRDNFEKMAAVYLSHKPKTVTGKHYTDPDFDRLAEALAKLRIQLEPMFDVVNDQLLSPQSYLTVS